MNKPKEIAKKRRNTRRKKWDPLVLFLLDVIGDLNPNPNGTKECMKYVWMNVYAFLFSLLLWIWDVIFVWGWGVSLGFWGHLGGWPWLLFFSFFFFFLVLWSNDTCTTKTYWWLLVVLTTQSYFQSSVGRQRENDSSKV